MSIVSGRNEWFDMPRFDGFSVHAAGVGVLAPGNYLSPRIADFFSEFCVN